MLLENKVAVAWAFARERAIVFLAGRTKAKPADEINSNAGSAATAAVGLRRELPAPDVDLHGRGSMEL